MLRHRLSLAAVIAALSVAGCGGDDNDKGSGPDSAGTPAAQACSPKSDKALKDAEFMMKSDDFDGALATIKPYLDCPRIKEREAQFRTRAARTTLRIARKRFAEYERKPSNDNSPQPAVSLARNSLRYEETPEAQAFLKKAEAALVKFKAKYGPRPDEEAGGPPPGAGQGGPPEGKGGD